MTADGLLTPYPTRAGETWLAPAWAVTPMGPITTHACRSCRASIAWLRARRSGLLGPVNPDGTSHFATCPDADAWRRTTP